MTCSFLSEVDFLKAELFARNLVAGDAKAAYEAGVRASFETWGVSGDVEEYLASTEKNEAGTMRNMTINKARAIRPLEKIITQKYIAGLPDLGAGSLE